MSSGRGSNLSPVQCPSNSSEILPKQVIWLTAPQSLSHSKHYFSWRKRWTGKSNLMSKSSVVQARLVMSRLISILLGQFWSSNQAEWKRYNEYQLPWLEIMIGTPRIKLLRLPLYFPTLAFTQFKYSGTMNTETTWWFWGHCSIQQEEPVGMFVCLLLANLMIILLRWIKSAWVYLFLYKFTTPFLLLNLNRSATLNTFVHDIALRWRFFHK